MFHNEFRHTLDNFNQIEGTAAKCEFMFRCNYVVEGLSEDEISRLSLAYRYSPRRHIGTDIISYGTYLHLTKNNTRKPQVHTATDFSIKVGGVDVSSLMTTKVTTKSKTEPPYTEFLIGAIKYDRLGIMSGHVTHGKTYDIIGYDGTLYKIINDKGNTETYHHSWFTPVKLYDEDETMLTCRDIDFNVEDYIDLRKHTPDQIRHIAKFYPVHKLDEVLVEYAEGLTGWKYLVFDGDDFDTHVEMGDYVYDGEEYTYDDIFYLEE